MNRENKNWKMQFRCTEEQKQLILKYVKEAGCQTPSEYFLKCCLYGSANNTHEMLAHLLTELEILYMKRQNKVITKKEFIDLARKEMEYAWSALK